eukprot:jgi/Undpi1/13486/HiC_scaffold_8.g03145.m1
MIDGLVLIVFQTLRNCRSALTVFQGDTRGQFCAHLYERLGAELGALDGMTMKQEFCDELVDACADEIPGISRTYDGLTYCEKHVGDTGDQFWSYPYTEPEIFEPGLNEVFPDLDSDDDFPDATISLRQSPDGTMYWLMGQQGEVKKVYADNLDKIEDVVDIADNGVFYVAYEEGLLDIAFDPHFSTDGYPSYFYLSYTCQLNDGENPRNRLSKFEYFDGDTSATLASEEVLITTEPKFNSIHAAGWCGFKPSAYGDSNNYHDLYWTTGDGGPQTDSLNTGQDTTNMLGSMIRISVPSDGTGYNIPSGNLGSLPEVHPEICASGFRNPFRCGFDRENDVLYCGDVGHTNVEEIDIIECGKNYGWSRFEGSRCQEAQEDRDGPCLDASRSGFTFPYFEYCHPDYYSDEDEYEFTGDEDICGDRLITGHAVIGGYVYRGNYFSDLLTGAYIFGDATNRNIYYVREMEGQLVIGTIVSDKSVAIISFSEDINGELMLLTSNYQIYHMPCGDLCATTCLEQSDDNVEVKDLGCYADDSKDRVLTLAQSDCDEGERAMSSQICASYCDTIGAKYAGVQFSYQCWCGGDRTDYDVHGTTTCTFPCAGNEDEICGGSYAMSVYSNDGTVPDDDTTPAPVTTLDPTSAPVTTLDPTSAPVTTLDPTSAPVTTLDPTSAPVTVPDGPTPSPITILMQPTPSPITILMEPTPSPIGVDEPAEYLGCFADSKDTRFMTGPNVETVMSAEICQGICDSSYYGTQYGEECWCGDDDTDYDVNGVATCDFACVGNSDEICGGRNAMSVYFAGSGSAPVSPVPSPVAPAPEPAPITPDTSGATYLGCYADTKDDRIMTDKVSSSSMTADDCQVLCSGSAFFGTQYGLECWCGASGIEYDRHGAGVCNFDCTGDSSEICGGRNAMSVYSF